MTVLSLIQILNSNSLHSTPCLFEEQSRRLLRLGLSTGSRDGLRENTLSYRLRSERFFLARSQRCLSIGWKMRSLPVLVFVY